MPFEADVSVVVPTWRRAAYLDRCLVAIWSQGMLPKTVIVVGRDIDQDARTVVESHIRNGHGVTWCGGAQPGHIDPVRRGLVLVQTEYVAFLDDDAEPEVTWLSAILKPLADPGVACVGGAVLSRDLTSQLQVPSDAGQIRWYGKHIGNVASIRGTRQLDVAGVRECNWAWRTDVLRSLRFEPRLDWDDASMYGLDLCLQAKDRELRVVYQPSAQVLHHDADRDETLDRADRPRRSISYSRNYTIIAMLRFSGFQRVAFVAWWWLLGDRGSYGPLLALLDALLRRPHIWELLRAGITGKWMGMRAWAVE